MWLMWSNCLYKGGHTVSFHFLQLVCSSKVNIHTRSGRKVFSGGYLNHLMCEKSSNEELYCFYVIKLNKWHERMLQEDLKCSTATCWQNNRTSTALCVRISSFHLKFSSLKHPSNPKWCWELDSGSKRVKSLSCCSYVWFLGTWRQKTQQRAILFLWSKQSSRVARFRPLIPSHRDVIWAKPSVCEISACWSHFLHIAAISGRACRRGDTSRAHRNHFKSSEFPSPTVEHLNKR